MKRLINHIEDDYIPTSLDMKKIYFQGRETVENFKDIVIKLAEYEDTGFTPEEITKLHKSTHIDIGKTVYAVVQYSKIGKYEVIKGTVTRKTIKSRNTFTVSGKYSNGNYYTGVFSEKAIGKSVFFNEEEANEKSCKLNSKKHS